MEKKLKKRDAELKLKVPLEPLKGELSISPILQVLGSRFQKIDANAF